MRINEMTYRVEAYHPLKKMIEFMEDYISAINGKNGVNDEKHPQYRRLNNDLRGSLKDLRDLQSEMEDRDFEIFLKNDYGSLLEKKELEFTKFEDIYNSELINSIKEEIEYTLTEDQEKSLMIFESMYNEGKITDDEIMTWLEDPTNEGVLGSLIGGLSGFALGKKMGSVIARVLGIEKGILYDLLTSRIFGAALGSSIGKQF